MTTEDSKDREKSEAKRKNDSGNQGELTKRREGTAAHVKGREKVEGTKGIDDRRFQRTETKTKQRERTTAEIKDREN